MGLFTAYDLDALLEEELDDEPEELLEEKVDEGPMEGRLAVLVALEIFLLQIDVALDS